MKIVIASMIGIMALSTTNAYAADQQVKSVGGCVYATLVEDNKTKQVTIKCPDNQVVIQYLDGTVKTIMPDGQIIETKR